MKDIRFGFLTNNAVLVMFQDEPGSKDMFKLLSIAYVTLRQELCKNITCQMIEQRVLAFKVCKDMEQRGTETELVQHVMLDRWWMAAQLNMDANIPLGFSQIVLPNGMLRLAAKLQAPTVIDNTCLFPKNLNIDPRISTSNRMDMDILIQYADRADERMKAKLFTPKKAKGAAKIEDDSTAMKDSDSQMGGDDASVEDGSQVSDNTTPRSFNRPLGVVGIMCKYIYIYIYIYICTLVIYIYMYIFT